MSNNSKQGGLTRRHVIKVASATGAAASFSFALPSKLLAADAPAQIPVGQLVPFTGSAAEYGTIYRDAAQFAFDQINRAAEEVYGGPIIGPVLVADSQALPTPAVAAARRMVEADEIRAMIAAWSSGVTVAVAASVTIPNGVLQVGNGTTSPLVTVLPEDEGEDLLFRTSPSDALQGIIAAQLAAGEIIDDYKFQKVSTIYINNPYGQGLSNAFADAFRKRGGTVLAEVAHPEEVQATYRSHVQAALEGDPDLILLPTYPAHTTAIIREARDNFDFNNWQFTDANQSDDILNDVGADTMKGQLGTVPSADPDSPTFQSFRSAFLEAYPEHENLQPFTETTYDAALSIGLAMAKAVADGLSADEIDGKVLAGNLRETSNAPGDEIHAGNQDSITAGVQNIANGVKTDYVGAGGSVDFDENGDVKTPYEIYRWTDVTSEHVMIIGADDIPSE